MDELLKIFNYSNTAGVEWIMGIYQFAVFHYSAYGTFERVIICGSSFSSH